MVLAVKFLPRSQRIIGVVLESKVVFPLIPGKVAYIIKANRLTDKKAIRFALEASFTKEEGCADENNSCDKVDNAEDEHESELIGTTFSYFLNQVEESFGDFCVSSDFGMLRYLLSLFLGKGHLDL